MVPRGLRRVGARTAGGGLSAVGPGERGVWGAVGALWQLREGGGGPRVRHSRLSGDHTPALCGRVEPVRGLPRPLPAPRTRLATTQ